MKVKAAAIVVFTFSGRAARYSTINSFQASIIQVLLIHFMHPVCRLVAKYKPPMPVLAVVFPREGSDPTKWRSYGTTQVSNMYIYNICLGFTTIFHFVEQNMPTYFTTSMLLSGKAMFCCKRCLPFDGEYWGGMLKLLNTRGTFTFCFFAMPKLASCGSPQCNFSL